MSPARAARHAAVLAYGSEETRRRGPTGQGRGGHASAGELVFFCHFNMLFVGFFHIEFKCLTCCFKILSHLPSCWHFLEFRPQASASFPLPHAGHCSTWNPDHILRPQLEEGCCLQAQRSAVPLLEGNGAPGGARPCRAQRLAPSPPPSTGGLHRPAGGARAWRAWKAWADRRCSRPVSCLRLKTPSSLLRPVLF